MKYILGLIFIIGTVYASKCNDCLDIITKIQSQLKILNNVDKVCKQFNFTECEDAISMLENSTNTEICRKLGYCNKLNYNNIVQLVSGPSAEYYYFFPKIPIQNNCYINQINPFIVNNSMIVASIIRDGNILKYIYDANSYDQQNCYRYIDNNGKLNLTVILQVEFDSPDWELFGNAADNDYIFREGTSLYCNQTKSNFIGYYANFLIVQTERYRYYINPDGSIFKKFEMEKILRTRTIGIYTQYGYQMSDSGMFMVYNNYTMNDPKFNNGTLMFSKNYVYINKYIVKNDVIKSNNNTYNICRVVDIDIKKLYDYSEIQ